MSNYRTYGQDAADYHKMMAETEAKGCRNFKWTFDNGISKSVGYTCAKSPAMVRKQVEAAYSDLAGEHLTIEDA